MKKYSIHLSVLLAAALIGSSCDELDPNDDKQNGEEKQRATTDALHTDEAHIGQPESQDSSDDSAD